MNDSTHMAEALLKRNELEPVDQRISTGTAHHIITMSFSVAYINCGHENINMQAQHYTSLSLSLIFICFLDKIKTADYFVF